MPFPPISVVNEIVLAHTLVGDANQDYWSSLTKLKGRNVIWLHQSKYRQAGIVIDLVGSPKNPVLRVKNHKTQGIVDFSPYFLDWEAMRES